jgi:hypothetical protein|tara:strand:+ start:645 stop:857 length:213 start_codon:yes stop_codon:yes gene_type:complete
MKLSYPSLQNFLNNFSTFSHFFFKLTTFLKIMTTKLSTIFKETIGDGYYLLMGLFLVFSADALVIDDEPL